MLLALFAALAVALVACGGDDGGSSDENPQTVLDQTFSGDTQVESAEVDISLDASVEGEDSGSFSASLSGPVDGQGNGFPKFDLTANVEGEGSGQSISFEGGATSTGDAAFVTYGGETYELGSDLFGMLEQAYEQGQAQQNQQQSSTAGLDQLKSSLTNLENEGTEDVEGTETVHVSGELDVRKLVKELSPLLQQASQLGLGGGAALPSESDLQQLQELVKSATFDVYSGVDDDILRRLAFDMELQDPTGGGGTANITFDLTLGSVNEDLSVEAPSGAKPIDELFQQLGIDPSALGALGLGGSSLGGSTGGSSGGSGSSGAAGDPSAFFDCLEKAKTAAEIQACSSLAP